MNEVNVGAGEDRRRIQAGISFLFFSFFFFFLRKRAKLIGYFPEEKNNWLDFPFSEKNGRDITERPFLFDLNHDHSSNLNHFDYSEMN